MTFITFAPFFSMCRRAFSLKPGETTAWQHGLGHYKLKYLSQPSEDINQGRSGDMGTWRGHVLWKGIRTVQLVQRLPWGEVLGPEFF